MKKIINYFLGPGKQVALYLIFGVLTTLINIFSYFIFQNELKVNISVSFFIAWFLSVTFAYLTNREYVFKSKETHKKEILKETMSFFLWRIASGILGYILFIIGVKFIYNDAFIWNILQNIIVIILNYVLSKLLIFKNTKK